MACSTTKLNFSSEEDEKLTEKVRDHPALYDLHHPLYRDIRVKDNIWKEIAEYVRRPVTDCKKRWKNIKDTYDRRKRARSPTGSAAAPDMKRKKWQLKEKLSFLQSTEAPRKTISNEKDTADVEITSEREVSEPQPECEQIEGICESGESGSSVNSADRVNVGGANKVKKSAKDNFLMHLKERDHERKTIIESLLAEEEDEVDLFFKSIAKTVKKLSPDFITQIKLQTLTLVSNFETEMRRQVERQLPSPSLSTTFSTPSPATSGLTPLSGNSLPASPSDYGRHDIYEGAGVNSYSF
ncbi:uncharacterized protein LOC124158590 [Ischnura elegans]|uniref:uncharacterized protein LOC124158590 n=1 Tax=Ischnura elegans TaxID=197161 RepID=UPI001ED87498|nr:uncharacterized protein LOC124158590 [Ischnura elegans]